MDADEVMEELQVGEKGQVSCVSSACYSPVDVGIPFHPAQHMLFVATWRCLQVDDLRLKQLQIEASFSQPNGGMCQNMLSWARSVTGAGMCAEYVLAASRWSCTACWRAC